MNRRTLVAAAIVAALTSLFIEGVKALPAYAHTGSPGFVTWSNGQTLTSTDLNNALAHIHNTFSGGIVDAHISSSAGISHAKLATPALVPKAWAYYSACDSTITGTCSTTGGDSSQVSSVTTVSTTGLYNVTLNFTPSNTAFGVVVTPTSVSGSNGPVCWVTSHNISSPQFSFRCETNAAVAIGTNSFTFVVYDS